MTRNANGSGNNHGSIPNCTHNMSVPTSKPQENACQLIWVYWPPRTLHTSLPVKVLNHYVLDFSFCSFYPACRPETQWKMPLLHSSSGRPHNRWDTVGNTLWVFNSSAPTAQERPTRYVVKLAQSGFRNNSIDNEYVHDAGMHVCWRACMLVSQTHEQFWWTHVPRMFKHHSPVLSELFSIQMTSCLRLLNCLPLPPCNHSPWLLLVTR